MNAFTHNTEENYIEIIQRLVKTVVLLLLLVVLLIILNIIDLSSHKKPKKEVLQFVNQKKDSTLFAKGKKMNG